MRVLNLDHLRFDLMADGNNLSPSFERFTCRGTTGRLLDMRSTGGSLRGGGALYTRPDCDQVDRLRRRFDCWYLVRKGF